MNNNGCGSRKTKVCHKPPHHRIFLYADLSEECLEFLLELGMVGSSHELVNDLSVLEEKDCGDIADTILHSDILTLLDITLADNYAAIVFLGEFPDDRSNHATWSTPCCPKINHQWQRAILQRLKVLSCNLYFHNLYILKNRH